MDWTLESRKQWFLENVLPVCGLDVSDMERLSAAGYFTAPSSRRRHACYEGGNFDHQYGVTQVLLDLTVKGVVSWQNPRSPYVVGMFHDICKCDTFTAIMDKNNPDKIQEYIRNERVLFKEHGAKSVMIASQYMVLTEEEVLCIRYHMGAYESGDWECFDEAIRKYPSVLWTHTADMYASKLIDR